MCIGHSQHDVMYPGANAPINSAEFCQSKPKCGGKPRDGCVHVFDGDHDMINAEHWIGQLCSQ
jgi:hypothetical protein